MTVIRDDQWAQGSLDVSGADEDMIVDALRMSVLKELGSTGLKRSAGYIDEEFLPQLRGRKAISIYKEMSENEPLVGGLLYAIDRLLRNVTWTVEPGGKSKEDTAAANLLETCMDDMSQPWSDFISEALSMLVYGWSWHEIVFKRRVGPWERDAKNRSKHTDGLVGIRKMPIRAQETLLRWAFDDSGDTRAMIQLAPPHYKTVALPIDRSLLFRFKHHKGNPEGVSLLRTAYRPWFMKKRLEEFEAIGIERDLAGLPIVKVPAEMLRAQRGTKQYEAVENFRKMVKTVRRNEQEGLVFPMAYDQDTKQPLYALELLGGGGSRAFNVDATIQRYEQRILMSVLADFIMVGHQATGSYSLHTDKTGIFRTSLNTTTQSIADVLNRHLVPRLFMANGWKLEKLPKIVPSDVDAPDIAVLSQFMSAMSAAGITWFPDPEVENFVRGAARLPKLDPEQEEARRQLQMRSEATQFAMATEEYLTAQQGAQMANMPLDEQAATQGAAEGVQQRALAETSGQAREQERAQEQAQAQAVVEDEERGHQRKMSLREMKLKEQQAVQAHQTSREDKAVDTALKVREQDSRERQTLAQVKAKTQAAKAKPGNQGKQPVRRKAKK